MRLALVVLAALASPAWAKRDPACKCASTRVLPAANAVDVPTNAHFWRLPSRRPGPPIKPYELAAHTGFVLDEISFTTGDGPDHEPPVPPSVAAASVTLVVNTPRAPVSLLHVTAATSADTAVVHLHFTDSRGGDDYYTTPDQLSVCEPDIALAPGHIRLDVTAIDLAGNESAPDTTELDTTVEQNPSPQCTTATTTRFRAFDEDSIAYAFLVALAGIAGFIYLATVRSRNRACVTVEPFALLAAAQLAGAVRMRSLATIMLAGIATSFALHDAAAGVYAWPLSPLAVTLVIDAGLRYLDAGRVRMLLRFDGATADVQYDTVGVVVGKQRETLRASPRLVDRARNHALPKATL